MRPSSLSIGFLLSLGLLGSCQMHKTPPSTAPIATPTTAGPLWQSAAYSVYPDSLVQGAHTARALSRTELTSDYRSPANEFQSPQISFKFSLNGKDNEMPIGQDHVFMAVPKADATGLETPLIVFGQQYHDQTPVPANTYLAPNTALKIRLDLRPLLAAFQKQGFYQLYTGQKLYKDDFKHVFVAGNTAPLSWDFDNLINKPQLELKDPDGDGIYETTISLNAHSDTKTTASSWKQSLDVSEFPQLTSDYPLLDALYNLSLEEAKRAVEPDGTFRTGQEWAGVWTRDISYSIILSQALLQPEVAKTSLLRKVTPEGRIIQDTGTGGAYPCSTDRIIWATAAWEIYKATGDEAWLRQVYPIIKNSIEDDQQVAYDPATGLVRGESSFLDWREQTYPKWMQPVDIYQSETLGTNAAHFQGNQVLALMADQLGHADVAAQHRAVAARIKQGINQHLWLEDRGYYGQYLYGRSFLQLSPKAEALGEALTVLFGVAEEARARSIVARTPVMDYGIPCIYPQISGIPPYHNNAVWPFVQSYWGLAAAQVGNETAFLESLMAVARPAALFLTNKENFVASNGDFAGTQINSSNMLWSLSGSLGLVYKGLFGMDFQADHLTFRPFVPQALQGTRKLTGFKYRQAVLNVEMLGYGRTIRSITLDGQPLPNATISATLTGSHAIRIELANEAPAAAPQNKLPHHVAPMTPAVAYANGRLTWAPVEGAKAYQVLRNGQFAGRTTTPEFAVPTPVAYTEYQVLAVDAQGFESYASEPLPVGAAAHRRTYELETVTGKSKKPYKGYTGTGFVEISTTQNHTLTTRVEVPETGLYAIDFRYTNGNGPINTSNKCAIRTLRLGQQRLGTVVLPQRGVEEWSDWGFSNPIIVRLEKGPHPLTLAYDAADRNMNGEVNQAMLDYMRLTRIK
ncbi:MGH1-like glycoside hydrolase domain-containing protein [Hymenobacter wooponensis]|uniref:Glycogen debranching protein n=1 Tax=Hymenobacter wooponensis TaxID=1525360 RepID=A0A4Z0MQP1_9BACT|nr:family 78 glycoside hydrolase catalytic domain [Hymenobacter wooponensis]TGD81658.1 glycogen debranching protein [Hymenobacter wooponensis]